MKTLSYDAAPFNVREDLVAGHQRAWKRLGGPGTWLDARTRIKVAGETRHAPGCALCRHRKAARSPFTIEGRHDSLGQLPDNWVEVIHRIVSDPGRLTHSWYERILASGIADTEYVEIVSLIAHITAIDTFARGLGIPKQPLPAPKDGAPSRYRPAEARENKHWVPTIAWDEHGPNEANFFVGAPANSRMALTLVPDEARSFFDLSTAMYVPTGAMRDFSKEYRAITHAQIELLKSRVSAINQCHYCTTRHALLLRASGEHSGGSFDLKAVTGGTAEGDTGVPNGHLLIEFGEAVLGEDDDRLAGARGAIVTAMGKAALVDAAGIVGSSNAINRVVEATGTPLDDRTAAETEGMREELGINEFAKTKAALDTEAASESDPSPNDS